MEERATQKTWTLGNELLVFQHEGVYSGCCLRFGVCINGSFSHRIPRLGSENQDLRLTYSYVIIIPLSAFLLLCKRKLITVVLFFDRIVQGVEEIITHEYALET